MDKRFLCAACELPEEKCPCARYCVLCQNPDSVRLVGDGFYYCADCREACEYKTEEESPR